MVAVNPLNIALSGLKVAQLQIGVISNNVSNVSTEGYTRKTLEQYSNVIGNEGTGVSVGNVQRRIDEILLRDFRTQVSRASEFQTRVKYLNQIQDFHGPPDSEQSLSAYIGQLKDSFAQLANQADNPYLLNAVYAKAQQVVDKFAGFSDKLTEMRNNAQTEMKESVDKINSLTKQISELNAAIKVTTTTGKSTAELEDHRDEAIKALSKEVDVSYFKTDENVVVVMTRQGQLMADTQQILVNFSPVSLGPSTYYPASAEEVTLGDPISGVNLTEIENLGGRLGALIELRDETLPTYQAQADEAAHKMALRFHNEGLDLFTLPDGTIPANTATNYVGFSSDMVVNPAVAQDITLIRKGTSPTSTVQSGSAEVLRKIVEFAFGTTQYQQALGTVDISNTVPTLFTTLGIAGQARIIGTKNIQSLGALDSSPVIDPLQDFTLRIGTGAVQTITITAGMTASTLVTAINTALPGMASLGSGGELILSANNDITIGAGTLGGSGLAELGLVPGITAANPPSFTIAAGRNTPTTIQILSTDTTTELLSKLNAVSGITASLDTSGFLKVIPTEGGDLTLTDGVSQPLTALGVKVSNIAHTAFNSTNLGPGANLSSGITGATTLFNYVAQSISLQSQDAKTADVSFNSEDNYRSVIEKNYLDTTGVNLDEEMSRLINVQTAYSASARTIRIAQELLDELMNTFVR